MLDQYIPILALLILAVVTGAAILLFGWLAPMFLKIPRQEKNKLTTYECGMQPVGSARERFNVKFYLVAMLFILFDIEVVFLYPWAVIYRDVVNVGAFIFWEVAIFALVLLVGLVYVWRTGALRWD
jgi:NADH-quinone oxidoreductase subunit A